MAGISRGQKNVEFCGCKCQLYDAANLVGCIGIELPL